MSYSNRLKYLITAPYSTTGGVASFVSSIFPYFGDNAKLFFRGSIFKGYFKILNPLLLIILPFRFLFSLMINRPSWIIINTSLSGGGILRDGLLVFISKIFKFKVLLIVHGFEEEDLRYTFVIKMGYFKANAIMVLSDEFSKQLIGIGCNKPISVFYNPVSSELINLFSKQEYKFLERDPVNFLFIARLEKEKGIYTAIDSFNIALSKYPNITLTVAGDGTEYKNAKQYVKQKNIPNVVFKGFVFGKQKYDLFVNSDALVFPTTYKEGLPINVLEAMTAGLIIITRPVGGLIDLFRAVEFGVCTESEDPQYYAGIITTIIESKEGYNKIRRNNNAFALQNFHPSMVVAKIEKIINHE